MLTKSGLQGALAGPATPLSAPGRAGARRPGAASSVCRPLKPLPVSAGPRLAQPDARTLVRFERAAARRATGRGASRGIVATTAAAGDEAYAAWDATTRQLALVGTGCFTLLLLPQVLRNASALAAGHPGELAIIAWRGYTTGLLGNLLLLSYFWAKRETAATATQLIGVLSTAVLLSQVYVAGFMPAVAFWPLMLLAGVGLTLCGLHAAERLPPPAWAAWQTLQAVVGLAVLPQVAWGLANPASTSLVPLAMGATLGAGLAAADAAGVAPPRLRGAWGALSAWAATLLFMFTPVAQLWANFTLPASLVGLSFPTILLGWAGNLCMLPRALLTRDAVWLTSVLWGVCLMGWGILLSMFLGRSPTGLRYVDPPLFCALTAGFVAWMAYVAWRDRGATKRA